MNFARIANKMNHKPRQQAAYGHHRNNQPAAEKAEVVGQEFEGDPVNPGDETAHQAQNCPQNEVAAEYKGIETDGLV